MNEKFEQIKEAVGKLSSKTKRLIIIGAVVLILGAVIIALVLNNKQPYESLFPGLGIEEAQQIVTRLQEEEIDFQYKGDATILVRKDQLDLTKAKLVQEGYPKSGFTYDTYSDHTGMMTTDSDKKLYKLYELQDRIGATIRLFDGVKDAKVTIALGEESKYALDDVKEKSSATAVVMMKDGGSPTKKQAEGIQRLIAKSIPGMELESVAVFDGNGNDISGSEDVTTDTSDAEELAKIVENQVDARVMKVLGPIYGDDNVKVSARAKINMEKLIRESITYNTPEKIDENDKTGIVHKEETASDTIKEEGGTSSGVTGTDANADTPQYATNENGGNSESSSETIAREYLVNQIKEQGQIDPGMLDDLTVSVAINGTDYGSLNENQVRALVSNASGIAVQDQEEKITVACAPFYNTTPDDNKQDEQEEPAEKINPIMIGAIIAGIVLLLLIVLVVILLIHRKHKKEAEDEIAAAMAEQGVVMAPLPAANEEIAAMQNDRGMELRNNVRDFTEQNAEISAQMLRNWLNGGDENGEA